MNVFNKQVSAMMDTKYGRFEVVAFEMKDGSNHMALIKGTGEVPIVRIQSHCLTSTAFHSVLCDCASQIDMAMRHMNQSQYAVMIYLDQEGRGHGLLSKIEIMGFLNRGMDIADAQRAAGKAVDRRDYSYVSEMLKKIGIIGEIDILTNNPKKIDELKTLGIKIRRRIPLVIEPETEQQTNYLRTKASKLGHWL